MGAVEVQFMGGKLDNKEKLWYSDASVDIRRMWVFQRTTEKFVNPVSSVQSGTSVSLTKFTGENFDTTNRRCQALMILCIEEAAGGALKWVTQEKLYPVLRRRCNFRDNLPGNAIGRFLFALRNRYAIGVKRKEDGKIVSYAVTKEIVADVRAGNFGEMPFGTFVSQPDDVSLAGTVSMTPAEPSAPPTYEELEAQLEAFEGGDALLPKKC